MLLNCQNHRDSQETLFVNTLENSLKPIFCKVRPPPLCLAVIPLNKRIFLQDRKGERKISCQGGRAQTMKISISNSGLKLFKKKSHAIIILTKKVTDQVFYIVLHGWFISSINNKLLEIWKKVRENRFSGEWSCGGRHTGITKRFKLIK